MEKYEYAVKIYAREDLVSPDVGQGVISCSSEGDCFFSRPPHPSMALLEEALNRMGDDGWELVQVDYHENAALSYWKREK
jgi:hypothetical protein